MKLAIIGSRSLTINNLEDYIPPNTVEIISGGAKGIDLFSYFLKRITLSYWLSNL